MYGWRAKIGFISPMGESAEHAFHIYAPEGVSFCSMKLDKHECLEKSSALYDGYDIDLALFDGGRKSFSKGISFDMESAEIIKRTCGVPAITVNTSLVEALTALNAKKIAVLTPYSEADNRSVREYLEDRGFEVTNIAAMDMDQYTCSGLHIEAATEYFLYQHSIHTELKGADVFLLCGMELATLEILPSLEKALGIPVVTSHQASLWSALRHSRVGAVLPALGSLSALMPKIC